MIKMGIEEKSGMLAQIIEQFLDRKSDSVSITKGMGGKYSWECKVYSENLLDPEKQQQVLTQLKAVDAALQAQYGDKSRMEEKKNE
jgi:hypothetical protein